LLFLDVGNFQYVNDFFGHEAGYQLVVVVAARLKE